MVDSLVCSLVYWRIWHALDGGSAVGGRYCGQVAFHVPGGGFGLRFYYKMTTSFLGLRPQTLPLDSTGDLRHPPSPPPKNPLSVDCGVQKIPYIKL